MGGFWDAGASRLCSDGLRRNEENARLLKTSAEIRELVESGELEQFNGVPNSHPNGFVVNCPAPILAPNNFSA